MTEKQEPLTPAERQIHKLESLRHVREKDSKNRDEKTFSPSRTFVERTIDRLQALRDQSQVPLPRERRAKLDGKTKHIRLSALQIKALEQLTTADRRLPPSRVLRIALNRLLGIENTALETELETLVGEILRRLKKRS